jgi:hypothetical protein
MVLQAGTGSVNVVDSKPQQLPLLKSAAKSRKKCLLFITKEPVLWIRMDPHLFGCPNPHWESGFGSKAWKFTKIFNKKSFVGYLLS